jgi:hypothetical protein
MKNRYSEMGWGLLIAGIGLVPISYIMLRSVPLISLGMAMMVLGAVCLVLGRARPKISPEMSMLLMETGLENLNSLLEEMGLKSRGIYLPSRLAGGKPRALIPLHSDLHFPAINRSLERRLIVSYGELPGNMGILVTTAGSNIMSMLEADVGTSSEEMSTALTTILAGILDIAASADIRINGSKAEVVVSRPRLRKNEAYWAEQSLGSPTASIAASLIAEVMNQPVVIEEEEIQQGEDLIRLRILHAQEEK